MTKSELKNGMRVKYRNGDILVVMLETEDGDVIANEKQWSQLSSYDNDLTTNWNSRSSEQYDIVTVYKQPYQPTALLDVDRMGDILWERKEEQEIEEISAGEAMRPLEESSDKKIKITR